MSSPHGNTRRLQLIHRARQRLILKTEILVKGCGRSQYKHGGATYRWSLSCAVSETTNSCQVRICINSCVRVFWAHAYVLSFSFRNVSNIHTYKLKQHALFAKLSMMCASDHARAQLHDHKSSALTPVARGSVLVIANGLWSGSRQKQLQQMPQWSPRQSKSNDLQYSQPFA